MTKKTQKPAGNELRPPAGKKPKGGQLAETAAITNARAREAAIEEEAARVKLEEALVDWLGAIAKGETMRGAAIKVDADHGVSYGRLRYACESDPEGWGARLDQAIAAKVETMERVLREVALGPPAGEKTTLFSVDPQMERVRASTAQWLLSKWDRKTYGDAKSTEISGPDGGPIPVSNTTEVTRYEYVAPRNPIIDGD